MNSQPTISVVIPVRDSSDTLRRCLEALRRSDCESFECVVVDDASSRPVADLVNEFGFRSVRSDTPLGPAAARNLGVRYARADLLFFTDADVAVKPDTVARVAEILNADEGLTAVIGSYDDAPAAADFISQYRNLLHHFVHQQASEQASTFWSGCGGVRREAFERLGGFFDGYTRPSVEDIEVGRRIIEDSGRILLEKSLHVKHLKKWNFKSVVLTDIRDRGFPWSLLLAVRGGMVDDLNTSLAQRYSVAICVAAVSLMLSGGLALSALSLLPLGVLITIGLVAPPIYNRLPSASLLVRVASAGVAAILLSALALAFLFAAEGRLGFWAACGFAAAGLLNARLFRFFYRSRGPLFAVGAAPFYLLHQCGNGLSFAAAWVVHGWRSLPLAWRRTRAPGPWIHR